MGTRFRKHRITNKFEAKALPYVKEISVPMITVKDLLTKYNIEQIDYLKIDTEGLDCEILKQFDVSNMEMVVFEWRRCPVDDTNREISRLAKNGFICQQNGDNIEAYK